VDCRDAGSHGVDQRSTLLVFLVASIALTVAHSRPAPPTSG
jgi:hypothetical protein